MELTDWPSSRKAVLANWMRVLDIAEATCRFSPSEGDLPAHDSFVEKIADLYWSGRQVDWPDLVFVAMSESVPQNWELVSVI